MITPQQAAQRSERQSAEQAKALSALVEREILQQWDGANEVIVQTRGFNYLVVQRVMEDCAGHGWQVTYQNGMDTPNTDEEGNPIPRIVIRAKVEA